jgi:hypothetical protein
MIQLWEARNEESHCRLGSMADGGANKMDRRVIPGGLGLRKLATKTNDLQYKDPSSACI